MASLNQFKLVNQKSESYFRLLESELKKVIPISKNSDRARFGFYLFILECITGIKDIKDLVQSITDTDFNKQLFGDNINDNGIDAIYINDEDREINLFNFKYREKFNEDSMHSENDVFISTKFIHALIASDTKSLCGKLQEYADQIIKCFDSNDVWKFKLYMISNESKSLDTKDNNIKHLQESYDLEVIPISLVDISNFMSLRPEPICSKMILDKEAILSYSEDELSSTKSYIVKLSIPDLLRITCNDVIARSNYGLSNYDELCNIKLSHDILFDNVRGYLGDTKYNKNIFRTLKNEPNRFFMYNNGLTITARNIETHPSNGGKKLQFDLNDIQVVNGGQTLRTLHEFHNADKSNLNLYLINSEILVRIFKTGNNPELTSNIAEYTNSQNAISPIDLKSISHTQMQIEQFLDANDIIYARKVGDTGAPEKIYKYKISMEKFAQIVFSINGNPEKASNQKKKIFEKYYNETFGEEVFDISKSVDMVNKYFQIFEIYKETTYETNDQKIFYILYLQNRLVDNLSSIIDEFEKIIKLYKKDEKVPDPRKLIQKGFLDMLNKSLQIT